MDDTALVGLAVSRLDGYRTGFNLCMVWKSHLIALRIAEAGSSLRYVSYIVFRNI
jgi:hypothetical protein